jgi:hypothetical protein
MTATKIDRGLVTRNTAAGLLRHRRHFLEIGAVRNPLGDFDIVLRLDGPHQIREPGELAAILGRYRSWLATVLANENIDPRPVTRNGS